MGHPVRGASLALQHERGAIAFSLGSAANPDDHLQEMTWLLGMLRRH
jgi:hypothetical protein